MPRRVAPLGVLLVIIGCADPDEPPGRYKPEPGAARAAVVAALEAWRAGRPADELLGRSPRVQVIDAGRPRGRKLVGFEVLGEIPTDAARTFAVRLDLSDPDEAQADRYVVAGIEPLCVFRQEDYMRITHWEHVPPPDPTSAGLEPTAK